MLNKRLIFLLFIIFMANLNCQGNKETAEYLKPKVMKADFKFLCKNLIDIHPDIYANFPKIEFEQTVKNFLSKHNTSMPLEELYYDLIKFIAQIKDDHTYLFTPDRIKKSAEYLPIYLKWFGDELRIIEAVGQNKDILKGANVMSLAGLSPDNLISRLWNFAYAENEFWVKERFTNQILVRSIM